MNILSFDIEEWYIEKEFHGGRTNQYKKYDNYLNHILNLLEQQGVKATFFCVGKLTESFPNIIKLIANNGHEIGCHSNTHRWLHLKIPDQL